MEAGTSMIREESENGDFFEQMGASVRMAVLVCSSVRLSRPTNAKRPNETDVLPIAFPKTNTWMNIFKRMCRTISYQQSGRPLPKK